MEKPVTAVYDANILYPAPLRDLFMRLAQAGLVAAAIRAGAEVIVTYNLRDFPAEVLTRYDVEALHPDDFLLYLLDLAPGVVCTAVKRQRQGLRNPPRTAPELLATLEGHGLTQAVARLRAFIDLL